MTVAIGWHVPERSDGRGESATATPFVPQGRATQLTKLLLRGRDVLEEGPPFHRLASLVPAPLWGTSRFKSASANTFSGEPGGASSRAVWKNIRESSGLCR